MKATAALLAVATWFVLVLAGAGPVTAAPEATGPRFSAPAFTETGYSANDLTVVTADLNGDATPDIAEWLGVCNEGLTVLLGRGDGSFRRPVGSCAAPEAGGAEGTAVADVNGDGRLDIMVALFSPGGRIRSWINDGGGRFHRGPVCWAGTWVNGLAAADLNADGIPDVLTQNQAQRELVVLLGHGGGRCGAAHRYTGDSTLDEADAGFGAIAVGDVNDDGTVDAVLTSFDTRSAVVRLGNGDGTFGPEHALGHARFGLSVALADFNSDGRLDVAATRVKSDIVVFLGNGDGTFGPMARYAMDRGEYLAQVALADFDGDGNTDMATLSISDGDNLLVRAGRGDGTFGALRAQPSSSALDGPIVADLNRDGRPDLAYNQAGPAHTEGGVGVSINWSGQPAPPCVPGFLFRKRLPAAKRDIRRAGCQLGAVRRRYSRKVAQNRVVSQRPRSGTILPARATVELTVSRGPRP